MGTDPKEVDYGTLYVSRFKVLRTAYAAWRKQCAGLHGCSYYFPDDYYAFTLANEEWLDDYALYMALKVDNGMKNWVEWDKPYRLRDRKALAAFAAENEEEIGFWKFVQYKFAAQWQAVKAYANKKDVQILGDIPIYVSADSVDAWVGGALFELDADGGFARVAGCPPDYFSADGQLWATRCTTGPTTKRPATRGGCAGCATHWHLRPAAHRPLPRLRYLLGHPGGQHHRPHRQVGERPRHGAVRCAGGCPWQAAHHCRGSGELFPSVRKLLADSTFPGMKVLQFAFSGGDSEYLPHNHVKNSVVYPGTHDNTTLTDWWENGASEKEKAAAAAYLHLTGVKPTAKELAAIRTDDVRIALLRAALGSVADRAIIPCTTGWVWVRKHT